MTTTTVTPAAASAELFVELSELLHRYDDAHDVDLDEAEQIRDVIRQASRRFSERVTRLRRKVAPKPTAASTPAHTVTVSRPAPAPVQIAEPPTPTPATELAPVVPRSPRRAATLPTRVKRHARHAMAKMRSTGRRILHRFAGEQRSDEAGECIVCWPDPCCSPIPARGRLVEWLTRRVR